MLQKLQEIWPVVLALMTGLNLALSGIAKGLEAILAVKHSDAGDKADNILRKALVLLQNLIDWLAPRTAKSSDDVTKQ